MKRIPAALMALCMLVSLCGCATVVPKKTWEDEFARGEEHFSLGEFEAAKRSFEAAIELEPTQTTPYIGLITACFRLGKFDELNAAVEAAHLSANDQDEIDARIEWLKWELFKETRTALYDDSVGDGLFQTTAGTEILELPDEAFGFVHGFSVDIDDDGAKEYVACFSERDGIHIKIYSVSDSWQVESNDLIVKEGLDYCSQINVILYRSAVYDAWCVAFERTPNNPYTGAQGFEASNYVLSGASSELTDSWEWYSCISAAHELDEAEADMKLKGFPLSIYLGFTCEKSLEESCWLMGTETSGSGYGSEYHRSISYVSSDRLEAKDWYPEDRRPVESAQFCEVRTAPELDANATTHGCIMTIHNGSEPLYPYAVYDSVSGRVMASFLLPQFYDDFCYADKYISIIDRDERYLVFNANLGPGDWITASYDTLEDTFTELPYGKFWEGFAGGFLVGKSVSYDVDSAWLRPGAVTLALCRMDGSVITTLCENGYSPQFCTEDGCVYYAYATEPAPERAFSEPTDTLVSWQLWRYEVESGSNMKLADFQAGEVFSITPTEVSYYRFGSWEDVYTISLAG